MIIQKDRKIIELKDKGKEFAKSFHHWFAQHEEEVDFLSGKISNTPPEFTEEE